MPTDLQKENLRGKVKSVRTKSILKNKLKGEYLYIYDEYGYKIEYQDCSPNDSREYWKYIRDEQHRLIAIKVYDGKRYCGDYRYFYDTPFTVIEKSFDKAGMLDENCIEISKFDEHGNIIEFLDINGRAEKTFYLYNSLQQLVEQYEWHLVEPHKFPLHEQIKWEKANPQEYDLFIDAQKYGIKDNMIWECKRKITFSYNTQGNRTEKLNTYYLYDGHQDINRTDYIYNEKHQLIEKQIYHVYKNHLPTLDKTTSFVLDNQGNWIVKTTPHHQYKKIETRLITYYE